MVTEAHGRGWRLYHGDCIAVMTKLDKVDHVLTDPPYSRAVHASVRSSRRNDMPDKAAFACRTRRSVDLGFEHLSSELRRACAQSFGKLARRWVAVFSDVESCHLWRRSLGVAGLDYVKTAEWRRLNGAPQFTGDRPATGFETITLAHRKGRKRWNGGGKAGTYAYPIVLNRGGKAPRVHTTQKPLELMLELVEDFTDHGDQVLDAFAGSGSTGVACLRLGRQFIGIERDDGCFRTACERLRAEEDGSSLEARRAGQVPLFAGSVPRGIPA